MGCIDWTLSGRPETGREVKLKYEFIYLPLLIALGYYCLDNETSNTTEGFMTMVFRAVVGVVIIALIVRLLSHLL